MKCQMILFGSLIVGFSLLSACGDPDRPSRSSGTTNTSENQGGNGDNQQTVACSVDLQCRSMDGICVDDVCVATCENDTQCGQNESCLTRTDEDGEEKTCQARGVCAFDSDCDGEMICANGQCHHLCEDDGECLLGEECLPRSGSAGGETYCQPADLSNQGGGCTSNSDCDEASGEFCDDVTGVCISTVGGDDSYFTVMIEDVTTGTRCNDTTYGYLTAGAKIMYAALVDPFGGIIAWGEVVDFDEGENADYGYPYSAMSGLAPDYPGLCPENESMYRLDDGQLVSSNFIEYYLVALGCGGVLFIQFRDNNNDLHELAPGLELEINAYGSYCNGLSDTPAQDVEDPYDIYLCSDDGWSIDRSTCDHKVNSAPAQGPVTLTL